MTERKIVNRRGKSKPKHEGVRKQANELGLTVAELQQARQIIKAVDLVDEAYHLVGAECFREIVAAL